MRDLVVEKADVIQRWVDAGKIAPVDPFHLIFAIWATTQHYADFDVQVRVITKAEGNEHFDVAMQTLETLFLGGLRVG